MKMAVSFPTRVMVLSLVSVLVLLSANTTSSASQPIIVDQKGRYLIDGTGDTIKLWDLNSGKELWSSSANLKCEKVLLDPQGSYVLTTHKGELIKLWDIKTGERLITINGKINDKWFTWIKIDPTGEHIIAGYKGIYIYSTAPANVATIWQAKTGRRIKTIRGLSDAQVDPKGRYLAGSNRSKGAKVVGTPSGFAEATKVVKVNPKFETMSGDTSSKSVNIWNLDTGDLTKTLEGHPDEVNKVMIDPTGNFVLGASYSGNGRG